MIEMQQMLDAIDQAQKLTKKVVKISWHVKVFEDERQMASFLNGQNAISVNIISHKEQIILLYGTN